MSARQHIGFFEDEHQLLAAARECRARRIPIADVISPYPLHGLDEVLGLRRSRLPWVTLLAGIVGGTLGLGFEYWSTATSWPLDVGGRPFDSFPAFVPVGFEMTILLAGLSTAGALLLRSRLFPGRKALPGMERTTDDRIALILEQRDASFRDSDFTDLFDRHGAREVVSPWEVERP